MLKYEDYEEHFSQLGLNPNEANTLLAYMQTLIEVAQAHLEEK